MKLRFLTSAVALTAMLLAGPVAAEPILIKFSHVVAENTPKGQMANKFRDLVAERLAGKVEVKVFPNSQLFGDNKVLEAMLLGDVQMAAPSLSKFSRYTNSLQLFDLPFLFNDIAAVDKFQNSAAGQKMLNSMRKKGIVGLGYLHNGMKQLSASSPLRTPADASGLKFRIMTSDVLAAQFEAVNATPLKKPFSEVFTLLQTKAIDGQENTWSNIYSQKFFEVQPYFVESNHGLLDYMLVTSQRFWKSLPADIRTELDKIITEVTVAVNDLASKENEDAKKLIIDSGKTEIIKLTAEEKGKWRAAMKPVWDQFKDEIGANYVEKAAACSN